MKTLKTLVLVSLLTVTQSFASNNTHRNIFLGISAGALVAYALESNRQNNIQTKIVHVEPYIEPRRYTARHIKKHRKLKRHHASQYRYNKHQKRYHRKHHGHGSYAYNKPRNRY